MNIKQFEIDFCSSKKKEQTTERDTRQEAQAKEREDTRETGRRQQRFTAQIPMDKDGCVSLPVTETQRHIHRDTEPHGFTAYIPLHKNGWVLFCTQ